MDGSCKTIAVGSPCLEATAGYRKELLVGVQYWWCTKARALNMINYSLHNEHLKVRMYGQKGTYCMVVKAPSTTNMNEKVMQRWGRWKSKVRCFSFLFYFCPFFELSLWSGIHCKNKWWIWRNWEKSGVGALDMKFPKNQ